jgi:hypothetical protein
MNWQMGNRTLRIHHRLQKVQHNKVADPGRFHGRMDGALVSSRYRVRMPLVSVL